MVDLDPQAAGERLEEIRERGGGTLEPKAVVEDARLPASPLHGHFEWDDRIAAQQRREDQARYLIRNLVVRIGEDKSIRAFVNVRVAEGSAYTAIQVAMGNEEMRRQVLQRAFRELEAWRERYKDYEELAAVFQAAEEARRRTEEAGRGEARLGLA